MEQKVKDIMGKIFDVDAATIGDESSIDTLENWDSLRHLNLVWALEEEFDLEFTQEQIAEMLNYRLILLTLQDSLSNQAK